MRNSSKGLSPRRVGTRETGFSGEALCVHESAGLGGAKLTVATNAAGIHTWTPDQKIHVLEHVGRDSIAKFKGDWIDAAARCGILEIVGINSHGAGSGP